MSGETSEARGVDQDDSQGFEAEKKNNCTA